MEFTISVPVDMDVNDFADAVWRGRNTGDDREDVAFELIKALEKWPEDWGFTEKVYTYLRGEMEKLEEELKEEGE